MALSSYQVYLQSATTIRWHRHIKCFFKSDKEAGHVPSKETGTQNIVFPHCLPPTELICLRSPIPITWACHDRKQKRGGSECWQIIGEHTRNAFCPISRFPFYFYYDVPCLNVHVFILLPPAAFRSRITKPWNADNGHLKAAFQTKGAIVIELPRLQSRPKSTTVIDQLSHTG